MRPLYPLLPALLLITCLFTHCRQPDKGAARFTPAAIPSFVAEIDITRDTVLYAPGGTRLHIPAHALDAGGATHAKLVIQEALRMSDIVRAGLFTTANGQLLSSGGMINIEPAPGQTLSIVKPIGISLPSPYLQKNMQLYKGVPDEQGNI
ncbi:MAG TPA: hypothetical protein VLD19_22000, partial [Chitinophagaceae bacterium]|nr:hypothetical protein [Chitinophagaceae bacterium]